MPTVKVELDNPANSLALNSDYTKVVIAGSHIFRIYSIGDSELIEKANLYAAKNNNPYFSSSDVVWSPIEENKLATVATNGAVVTWDLNKSTRSKLDMDFKDNERPVNKVSFHPVEPHLLISGLKGGLIKLFDTRRKEAVTTFLSNNECVRDIQFSPHYNDYFAAGTENGNLQFWDMRKPDRPENQFTEHRGPIFALDWHSEYKLWIATAGRDKTIKVWDLSGPTSSLYNSIRTVAAVGRVKWRPNKNYHIASCALMMDCSINVWDIRRPYIPFSAFHKHRNVPTGIAWQGNAYILLSVGKDNTLYYHSIEDATYHIENTNPDALDISPQGVIVAAKPKTDNCNYSGGIKRSQHRKTSIANDSFGPVISMLNLFNIEDEFPASSVDIQESAVNYRLTGRPLAEICEHNASIAKKLNRNQVAMTWQIVQILFGGATPTSAEYGQQTSFKEDSRTEANTDSDQKHVRHVSGEGGGDTTGGTGATSAEEGDTETDDNDNHDMKLMHIASGSTIAHEYFIGDDELSQLTYDYDNLNSVETSQVWVLPDEAFQPRRDIVYHSNSPPDEFSSNSTSQKDETSTLSEAEDTRSDNRTEYVIASSLLRISEAGFEPPPMMDFTSLVVDVVHYYATIGDVQMAVTLVIVLGDRIKNLVDEFTLEHWFLSYIEILHKLKLWNTATEIIQLAHGIPQVQSLNQQATTVRLQCGLCNKSLMYGKGICKKCGSVPSRCAVCHCPVQGLFVWCQECCHGGHINHMLEWIKDNPSCPTGCGHHCEYN